MSDPKPILPLDVFLSVLSVVAILACLWFAFPSFLVVKNVQESLSWPTVQGKVISSSLELSYPNREDAPNQQYLARVWFGYSVGGKKYTSNHLNFAQEPTVVKDEALNKVRRYVAGSPVAVRYSPKDPELAVVETDRIPSGDAIKVGFSLLIVAAGVMCLLGSVSRGRMG